MKAYTDYPITVFKDKPGEIAPIREVTILSYDGDKYCKVRITDNIGSIFTEIKSGYLYLEPGRVDTTPSISRELLNNLPRSI
jgi:hypothetical protein